MSEQSRLRVLPVADPEVTCGQMRMQTMPAITYLYASKQTTTEAVRDDIDELMVKTDAAQRAAPGLASGPYLFSYIMGADTSAFEMRIGFPVPTGTMAPEGLHVVDLGEFRCASLVYCGSLEHISRAWGELMNAMQSANLTPRAESREWYLYFENEDSPNNVLLLQAAI